VSRKRNPIGMQRHRVAESAATVERTTVAEAGVAEAPKDRPGRLLIRLISAGWSLNGNYYPAEVLKRDGANAWPRGTQAFIDHATDDEDYERPAGSVKNLAAIQTEDAHWDEDTQSLVAWTRLLEPWRTPLTDMAKAEAEEGIPVIGMSIRAWVTAARGERDGRTGNIVSAIDQGRSVDFVTKPAAGGAILAVLESIQQHQTPVAEAASIGTYLESRLHLTLTSYADDMYAEGHLTRDERIALSSAIGDGLGAYTARIEADAPQLYERSRWAEAPADGDIAEALADDTRARLQAAVTAAHGDDETEYTCWVHDFDPAESYVIFANDGKTWRQTYASGEDGISLTGDPVEVTRRTTYVPVDTPAAEAPAAAPIPPELLAVTETATVLDRAAQALQNSPTPSVTANADGSPPTATTTPETEGVSTMSGTTNEGAPPAAGNPNGTPVDEALAVVAKQRDDAVNQLAAITEALTDARSAERTANAERDAAIAEARVLKGNEAGRTAVDKALAANESGMPETMLAAIGPRVHAAVNGRVPMTDDGKVNAEALAALVTSAIKAEAGHAAAVLESQGVGRPSGLGGSDTVGLSEADFESGLVRDFMDLGMDEATAKLAAKGR
jgi:hypothetical protein